MTLSHDVVTFFQIHPSSHSSRIQYTTRLHSVSTHRTLLSWIHSEFQYSNQAPPLLQHIEFHLYRAAHCGRSQNRLGSWPDFELRRSIHQELWGISLVSLRSILRIFNPSIFQVGCQIRRYLIPAPGGIFAWRWLSPCFFQPPSVFKLRNVINKKKRESSFNWFDELLELVLIRTQHFLIPLEILELEFWYFLRVFWRTFQWLKPILSELYSRDFFKIDILRRDVNFTHWFRRRRTIDRARRYLILSVKLDWNIPRFA